MWRVAMLDYRDRVLDFTSSGQGQQRVTSLFADGRCLANAVSLMAFDTEQLQVEICEDLPVEAVPRLSAHEAVRLLQFAAPARPLGHFPDEPRVRDTLIAASTTGIGIGPSGASLCLGDGVFAELIESSVELTAPADL